MNLPNAREDAVDAPLSRESQNGLHCLGRAVDLTAEVITIEATGSPAKLDALLALLEPYGIRELVQSGIVGVGRGPRSITDRSLRTA